MSGLSITTNIIQKLSNNNSVIPIAAKDTLSNCAITCIYDKTASKEDGKEKAIEEFGTEFLWIGGIPLLKKVFDKTVYKIFGANPNVDIRKFQKGTADSVQFAKDKLTKEALNVPKKLKGGESQAVILQHALEHQKLYKGLNIAKFIVSTVTSLAALSALIIYKQKTTNKALEEKYKKKMQFTSAVNDYKKQNPVFNSVTNEKNNASKNNKNPLNFKGEIGKFMSGFIYNPVQNMFILDCGITSTRLGLGREGEKFEVGFKELFQIIFIYCLAKPIQKGFEWLGANVLKRPIETEYQLLSDDKSKALLKTQGLDDVIKNFKKLDDNGVINYVYDNDNALVKLLKKSGYVPTVKGKDTINSLKFMDAKEIKQGADAILKLIEGHKGTNVDFDKYLSQVKKFKGASVVGNILIGAFAMGVLQPVLNIIIRKIKNNGESANPAFKNIEQDMQQKFS